MLTEHSAFFPMGYGYNTAQSRAARHAKSRRGCLSWKRGSGLNGRRVALDVIARWNAGKTGRGNVRLLVQIAEVHNQQ